MIRVMIALVVMLLPTAGFAHEMRPAYLAMDETAPGAFNVFWKVPAMGDQRLGLALRLPSSCTVEGEARRAIEADAYTERYKIACDPGLGGQTIRIDGLQATMTDVLARIAYLNGSIEIARAAPDQPAFTVTGPQSSWQVAATYFVFGVDHILAGFDHLVFVLALILLIHDRWTLVKTVTAFTLAHSITLAGATLGLVSLPQKPVEAAIALSIAFLAVELVKSKPGRRRTSEQYPWVVAFVFGLLHGFGFAGALRETGLPQSDVMLALLTFNLGVEAGQLLFVATVLLVGHSARRFAPSAGPGFVRITAYGIGAMSMFWLITRLASLGA